jgi:arylsulfatase A-like enzyme
MTLPKAASFFLMLPLLFFACTSTKVVKKPHSLTITETTIPKYLEDKGTNAGASSPKIVILEFHGMKQGIIAENLKKLPSFQELTKGSHNDQAYVHLPRVLTTIPAASVPATSSMYTGLLPWRTGIVSTIWFDRRTTKVRTMISYSQKRINRILASNGVKTLFDYIAESGKNSMSTMLMITKGADWSIKSGVFFWGNAALVGFFRNGRWFPDSQYIDQNTISAFLRGHLLAYNKSLAGILEYHHTIPDVMVVQLLGTDLFSHYPPRELRKQNASMDEIQKHYAQTVLDSLMGTLIRYLKKAGCYEDCIFILVSEHGFTKISKHVPDNTLDHSLKKSFKLPDQQTSNQQAEAVIMLGASTKEIYLKNRQTGNWMDPPRLLADVKPAVDLVLANSDIQNCMNTLVIRQYPGERHGSIEENDHWWVLDWKTYQATDKNGVSFLQALRPLSVLEGRFELGKYVVRGLRSQYTRETAPDIKVINKKGFYFERDFDKYGHHGSYYPSDCIVSFWVAGPGLRRILTGHHLLERTSSTLDLVPMVAYLLGIPQPEGLDGNNPLENLQSKRIRKSQQNN